MASRGGGRGRGRGQLTFNMEAVGISKGDALPPPTLQPSPLFPVSVCPPSPWAAPSCGLPGTYCFCAKLPAHPLSRVGLSLAVQLLCCTPVLLWPFAQWEHSIPTGGRGGEVGCAPGLVC